MMVQIIGCVLTMLLVMYLCYKGISPIICAPIAVIGICIATRTNINTAVFETFAQGIGNNVTALLFYFCASGFMSLVMQETGAADSIASLLSKYIGEKHVPVCIILVCGVLSMAGLGIGAMIIAFSVGVSLCRKANYSTDIIYASVYAGCIFVSLPYVASANNMLASIYCGTDASAGATLGFTGFGAILSSSILYLEWLVRRWKKQGRVFEEGAAEQKIRDVKDCPNIILAVLPLVVTILLYNILNWNISFCIFIGGILVTAFNFKRFHWKQWFEILTKGMVSGVMPTINMSFMGAIGTVLASTSLFGSISELLEHSDMNVYLLTAISVNLFCFFIGAASSSMNIVGTSLMPIFIRMAELQGLSVGNLHRLFIFSASGLDSVPSSGGMISLCNMFGTTMKKSYPPVFVTGTLITIIVIFVILVPLASVL